MPTVTLKLDTRTAARVLQFLAGEQAGDQSARKIEPNEILASSPRGQLLRHQTRYPTPPGPMAHVVRIGERAVHSRCTGKVSYRVLGVVCEAPNANAALVDSLQRLSRRDPGFLSRLARAVPGTKRNHIAESPERVYPGKPALAKFTTELAPGWYIGTNIANREKTRILKIACELLGLVFGSDLVIDLPNAS